MKYKITLTISMDVEAENEEQAKRKFREEFNIALLRKAKVRIKEGK